MQIVLTTEDIVNALGLAIWYCIVCSRCGFWDRRGVLDYTMADVKWFCFVEVLPVQVDTIIEEDEENTIKGECQKESLMSEFVIYL